MRTPTLPSLRGAPARRQPVYVVAVERCAACGTQEASFLVYSIERKRWECSPCSVEKTP